MDAKEAQAAFGKFKGAILRVIGIQDFIKVDADEKF
jgi:hypothetical protein